MHQNNPHKDPYNFELLLQVHTSLEAFVFTNKYKARTIDFANPQAVFHLNKALLLHHYKLDDYELPPGYLCPGVPGRADYLCYVESLLAAHQKTNNDSVRYKALDIGVGANCIYPIIGAQLFNWQMVGADINSDAIASAKAIVGATKALKNKIEIRQQPNNAHIFMDIIKEDEYFDITICNPPFHTSELEATKGTLRKLANISKDNGYVSRKELIQNFGGKANELWCNGGEALFIKRMIKQSVTYKSKVGIFTTLVSNKAHLNKLYKQLEKAKANHTTVAMPIGNKTSRMLAWSFDAKKLIKKNN